MSPLDYYVPPCDGGGRTRESSRARAEREQLNLFGGGAYGISYTSYARTEIETTNRRGLAFRLQDKQSEREGANAPTREKSEEAKRRVSIYREAVRPLVV